MDSKLSLIELIRQLSYQYNPEPVFKLSSGAASRFYFNMKKTTHSPKGLYLVGKLFYEKIMTEGLKARALGGLTMGADPIASAVARYSYDMQDYIEGFVIRKEAKGHGMGLQIEGNVKEGDRVIIVDDVVTTGGSTIKAIEIAQAHKLLIEAVIILVDRCEFNGRQNIEALGYPVYDILTVKDFLELQAERVRSTFLP